MYAILSFLIFAVALYLFDRFASGDRAVLKSVEQSVDLAIDNLLNRKIKSTGLWIYDYNIIKDEVINYGYGVEVRLMGVTYIWGNIIDSGLDEDKTLLAELKDSLDKILENTEIYNPGNSKLRLLTYHDENKIGSLALLYMGGLSAMHNDPNWKDKNEEKINEILNTILWLQKKNGDFAQTITFNTKKSDIESLDGSGYALGESMLALVRASKEYPKREDVQNALKEAALFLKKRGVDTQYKGLYLWLMTVAYEAQSAPIEPELKAMLEDLAKQYHLAMRSKLVFYSNKYNTCAHTEGLARYILLEGNNESVKEEREVYLKSILANMNLQIIGKSKEYILKSNPEIPESAFENKYATGAFLDSLQKGGTRIDYTQHCINAFLPIDEIL